MINIWSRASPPDGVVNEIPPKTGSAWKAYRLQDRVNVCPNKTQDTARPTPASTHPNTKRSNAHGLNSRVRSRKSRISEVGWTATNRNRYPYELTRHYTDPPQSHSIPPTRDTPARPARAQDIPDHKCKRARSRSQRLKSWSICSSER
jgi:hypothetical protein